MEKDGDSEEDNDEEVVKQVVKRRFEGRANLTFSRLHYGRSLYHSKMFFPSFPPTSLSVLTPCSCLP
jgi:hypothetical protein